MRKSILGVVFASILSSSLATTADAAVSAFQLGSSVAAGFYSNLATPAMQDPSSFGYTSTAVGPYLHGAPLLGTTPPAPIYPGFFPGNNFQAGGFINSFNDGLPLTQRAAGSSIIKDSYLTTGVTVDDFSVDIPFWKVGQQTGATGYVVNQLNFVSTYNISPGFLLGSTGPRLPMSVSGIFGPAGYAQFDAVMSYTFTPFNSTSMNLGVPIFLGNLSYAFDAAVPSTPFSTIVNGTGTVSGFTNPTAGILEIHGHAWIAGDPFELEVASLPEPVVALPLVCIAFILRRRRS